MKYHEKMRNNKNRLKFRGNCINCLLNEKQLLPWVLSHFLDQYFRKAVNTTYFYLFLFISLSSLPSTAQSLDEHIQTAARNNPGLQSKHEQYLAALEKVPQVKSLPDPQLSFGYFITTPETRVGPQLAKFSVSQMFPWLGTLDAKSKVAAEHAKVKYEQFRNARNKLYYQVRRGWYELYDLEKQIELTKENIEILSSFESLAIRKYEAGLAEMVDVIRVQLQISEKETDLELLKDSRKPKTTAFNALLNRNLDAAVDVPQNLEQMPMPVMQRDSLQAHPSLTALRMQESAYEQQQEAARLQGLPQFGVGLDYVIVGRRTDMELEDNGRDIFMPMVSVSLPVFRKKYQAMKNEALHLQQAAQLEQQQTLNHLETEFEMALRDYEDANRRHELYEELIAEAKQGQQILVSNFSAAGKDFEEILRMQQLILKYKLALEKAKVDRGTAVAKLRYLLSG